MEQLLRPKDIAAMLGTTPGVAASVLADHGVCPIDWGVGRSRGLRWLKSAVEQAILDMHQAAQPKPKSSRPKTVAQSISLSSMSVHEIYQLTQGRCVQ